MKKFFGEYYPFIEGDGESKQEAKTYLQLWKKNLMFKLHQDSFHCELVEEFWSERPAYLSGSLVQNSMMVLKLNLEGKWDFEIK